MRSYVNGHQAVTEEDFAELGLGTSLALWLGEPGESPEERAAREDAGRDILADDPELPDRLDRLAVEVIEARAPQLAEVIAMPRVAAARSRSRKGAAA
ncbi:hypothetical protein [Streptomyces boninensis]|uniref:hypothetical protein n=1 Tax=Streptomyces boninensis TaxID=2039455 RepID=UPI003B2244A0